MYMYMVFGQNERVNYHAVATIRKNEMDYVVALRFYSMCDCLLFTLFAKHYV